MHRYLEADPVLSDEEPPVIVEVVGSVRTFDWNDEHDYVEMNGLIVRQLQKSRVGFPISQEANVFGKWRKFCCTISEARFDKAFIGKVKI